MWQASDRREMRKILLGRSERKRPFCRLTTMLMEIRDLKYLRKQHLTEYSGKWEEIQSA